MWKLVIEVGVKIMEIYEFDDFDVKFKFDDSFVIVVDQVVDVLIFLGLMVVFFDVVLVIEE